MSFPITKQNNLSTNFVVAVSENTDYVERMRIDGTTGATNFTENATSDGTIGFNLEPTTTPTTSQQLMLKVMTTRVYNGPTL